MTRILDRGESECGQDCSAELYAEAKRIETEQALARRDLELVSQLNIWRSVLSDCRLCYWNIEGIGGGTLWGHGANRECAEIEDFLAYLATRMPFADGEGSPQADKILEDTIVRLNNLRPDYNYEASVKEEVAKATTLFDDLKDRLKSLPAFEAKEIAAFTSYSLTNLYWQVKDPSETQPDTYGIAREDYAPRDRGYVFGRVVSVGRDRISLQDHDVKRGVDTVTFYSVLPDTECANFSKLSDVHPKDEIAILYTSQEADRTATFIALVRDDKDVPRPHDRTRTVIGQLNTAVALRLGPYRLAEILDRGRSEMSQDYSASYYADAKRLKTEQELAERDLRLLPELEAWRSTISACRKGLWDLNYYALEGGTMWGHCANRDCAECERFLAFLAARMPYADGKGSAVANKIIDDAIKGIKKSKSYFGDTANFRAKVKQVTENWELLRDKISVLPEFEANEIAWFVTELLR